MPDAPTLWVVANRAPTGVLRRRADRAITGALDRLDVRQSAVRIPARALVHQAAIERIPVAAPALTAMSRERSRPSAMRSWGLSHDRTPHAQSRPGHRAERAGRPIAPRGRRFHYRRLTARNPRQEIPAAGPRAPRIRLHHRRLRRREWSSFDRTVSYRLPPELVTELEDRLWDLRLPVGVTVAAAIADLLDKPNEELVRLVERAEEAKPRRRSPHHELSRPERPARTPQDEAEPPGTPWPGPGSTPLIADVVGLVLSASTPGLPSLQGSFSYFKGRA